MCRGPPPHTQACVYGTTTATIIIRLLIHSIRLFPVVSICSQADLSFSTMPCYATWPCGTPGCASSIKELPQWGHKKNEGI